MLVNRRFVILALFLSMTVSACKSNSTEEASSTKDVVGPVPKLPKPHWEESSFDIVFDTKNAFEKKNPGHFLSFWNLVEEQRDSRGEQLAPKLKFFLVAWRDNDPRGQLPPESTFAAKSEVELKFMKASKGSKVEVGVFFNGNLVGLNEGSICLDREADQKQTYKVYGTIVNMGTQFDETVPTTDIQMSKCNMPNLKNGKPFGEVIVLKK